LETFPGSNTMFSKDLFYYPYYSKYTIKHFRVHIAAVVLRIPTNKEPETKNISRY
jgi:hypothetical protein